MPSLEPKSNYEPSRELDPDQLDLFPEQTGATHYIARRDPPPQQVDYPHFALAPPPVVQILDLGTGKGAYRGYTFNLSPTALKAVRDVVIDAVSDEVQKLRGENV